MALVFEEVFLMAKRNASSAQAQQRKGFRHRQTRARNQVAARQEAEVRRVEGLPVSNPRAAGVDIGSWSHWVCVGLDESTCREFPAHTDGLHALVAWLHEHQVTTVAMESTGVYWIPLYELLETEGFEVLLVDPSYTKQVRGRPKTDRRDCQWIYRLHSVGLLAAAFRPDEKTCQLRSYLRQRANLIRYAGQHTQHMQKALEQMNLKLTEIISDITGRTGSLIIQAILRGVRDPEKLARYRHPLCKASSAEIAQALTGTYRDEHLFALWQAYHAWQFYRKQRDEIDERIAQQLAQMKQNRALPPLPPRSHPKSTYVNEPRFDVRCALYYVVGIDLTEIEGIAEMTALTIISEIGPEVSKFDTVKHFCSWLGLCPQLKKTGGRVRCSTTRPGANRVATALRMAVTGLYASKGALGAFLRHKKAHLGAPKAITATAHKLARIVYLALKHGLTYVRQTQEAYQAKVREQQLKALKKKARQLGVSIVEPSPQEAEGEAAVPG
jgi:transposase